MSGVVDPAVQETEVPPPEAPADDTESRARRMGWVPREEFRGSPERWTSAEEFLRIGDEKLPVMRERQARLERQLSEANRNTAQVLQIAEEMRRSAARGEQRAYERAKAELLAEQRDAVTSADTSRFERAQQQIAELEKEKPPPAPPVVKPAPSAADHEVVSWTQRQKWWNVNKEATAMAVAIHGQLLADQPTLSMADNLDKVESRVRRAFPEDFEPPPPPPPPPANPRRDEPAAVASGVAGGGGPPPKSKVPSKISDLPAAEQADARKAFDRWQKQMPTFTEAEYVAHYTA